MYGENLPGFADEFDRIAAEADSFVGQTPPQEPGPLNYFTPTSSQTADAFDSVVGQSMPPTSVPFSAPAPPTTSSAVPFDTPLSQPAAPPPPQSFAAIPTMTPPPRGKYSLEHSYSWRQGRIQARTSDWGSFGVKCAASCQRNKLYPANLAVDPGEFDPII